MTSRVEQAIEFADKDFGVIPLDGKVPFFEDWPNKATKDRYEIKKLFANGKWNIGVPTGDRNKLLVVDVDEKIVGRKIYLELKKLGVLNTIVETRRGVHFAFQPNEPNVPNSKLYFENEIVGDIKCCGGQVCWPTSEVQGHTYRFIDGHGLVPPSELAKYNPEWFPAPKGSRPITREAVRNAMRYIMTIDSIQGTPGSNGLVRACAVLRDSGLSEAESMVHLIAWNESGKAVPPWSLAELARALKNTYAKGKR